MSTLDVESGAYAQELVVQLSQNQSVAQIQFPHRFEHVKRIELLEICVRGAATVGTWRVNLASSSLQDAQHTNMLGNGYVFIVDNTTLSHTEYNFPRTVSTCPVGFLNALTVSLQRVDPNASPQVVTTNFTEAVFFFRVVCRDPKLEQQLQLAAQPSLQFSGRNEPFYYPMPTAK